MGKIIKFVKENYILSICIAAFIVLLIIMTILGIFRRGTFSIEEDVNKLVLECPKVFSYGDTVECDVSLEIVDNTKVLSLNANYDFADGITIESFSVDTTECTGEGCIEPFVLTDNGFTVINEEGFTGSLLIGKLRIKTPSSGEANSEYKVGLKEIELSYEDASGEVAEDMIELNAVSVMVRSKNNVATLSNITLSSGSLNEEFDSDTFNYTSNVGNKVSSLTINYTLTDENAVAGGTGSVGEVQLHYGHNKLNINVVAEDGVTTKTYNIDINREYEFSTETYIYNKDDNYIYVGFDDDFTVINSLEKNSSDNLSYLIQNNKLLIYYGEDDLLKTIDIVRFSSTYRIVDNKIFIGSDVTYKDIKEDINSNNDNLKFTVSITDTEDIIDDTVIILDNYKFNVKYDGNLLTSYTFVTEYFSLYEDLLVANNVIIRLPIGITVGELLDKIHTNSIPSVISNDGSGRLSEDSVIKTGDLLVVTLSDRDYEFKLSVLGDIDGDGNIRLNDAGMAYRYYRGKIDLESASIYAVDSDGDGSIRLNDAGILYRYYRGKRRTLDGED